MRRFGVYLLTLSVAACAGYRPIVDMKGVDAMTYEQDLAECQAYAEQVNPVGTAIAGALLGAAIGAALGAVTGAAFDADVGDGAAWGAAYGGTAGTAAGAVEGAGSQVDIIRRCMTGRGYSVLQ